MKPAAGRQGWQGPQSGEPCRVLVVDDDLVCLKLVEQMLRTCNYDVTCCVNGRAALERLRDQPQAFDLVLSDVYMPDMDGFKLLEHVGLELDLPVIMMSSNGETAVVLEGVTHGAVDFLIKPVRIEELRNLWQHVIRRRKDIMRTSTSSGEDFEDGTDSLDEVRRADRKRKDQEQRSSDEASQAKKARVVWTPEMHQQFVEAVQALGIDKAVPKKILELMPRSDLTRENVASHLQKYRAALKRGLQDPMGSGPMGTLRNGVYPGGALDLASQYAWGGMMPLAPTSQTAGSNPLLNGPQVWPSSYLAAAMRPQGQGYYPQGSPSLQPGTVPVLNGGSLQQQQSPVPGASPVLGASSYPASLPPQVQAVPGTGLQHTVLLGSQTDPGARPPLWSQPHAAAQLHGTLPGGAKLEDSLQHGVLADPFAGQTLDGQVMQHGEGNGTLSASQSVDDMLSMFLKSE